MISFVELRCERKPEAFLKCEGGVAFVEFAIVVPLLILLFLATVEICRFILITQKLENTVSMVTDVVTQYDTAASGGTAINSAAIQPIYSAVQDMMNPYAFGANGFIILTDVQADSSGNPVVQWQSCYGTLAATSTIGAPGARANFTALPGGAFTMSANEEIVVGEAFYNFTPITSQNFLSSVQLYRTAIFAPRLNTLVSSSPPTCP